VNADPAAVGAPLQVTTTGTLTASGLTRRLCRVTVSSRYSWRVWRRAPADGRTTVRCQRYARSTTRSIRAFCPKGKSDAFLIIGFIQYITAYRFIAEYEEGVQEIRIQVPISDGGCGGTIPAKYQGPTYLPNGGSPWYQPPLLVKEAGPGKKSSFGFYGTSVNDGPAFHLP
jgi:hypothetical protein